MMQPDSWQTREDNTDRKLKTMHKEQLSKLNNLRKIKHNKPRVKYHKR